MLMYSRTIAAFRILLLVYLLVLGHPKGWAQSDKLSLVFAGDIMMHQSQIDAARTPDGNYDFEPVFRYVRPVLEKADLAIGNLELTLPGKPPYTGYPSFKSPDTLADALREAGFDILVTSNNHSNDSGKRGILKTIECLNQRGFIHTGTFADSTDRSKRYPLLIEHKGFRLVFLNYTYGTNHPHIPEPCIINLIDTAQIDLDLAYAKKWNPDLIIAFMHWGYEYHLDENKQQQEVTRQLFLGGVDLIIGAHPHVIQPVKLLHDFSGSSPRRGVVAYSLGNFVSGQVKKYTDLGLLFEVDIRRHPVTGDVFIDRHHYLPVWRYRGVDTNGRRLITALPVGYFLGDHAPFELSPGDKKRMEIVVRNIRSSLSRFNSSERALTLTSWIEENTRK